MSHLFFFDHGFFPEDFHCIYMTGISFLHQSNFTESSSTNNLKKRKPNLYKYYVKCLFTFYHYVIKPEIWIKSYIVKPDFYTLFWCFSKALKTHPKNWGKFKEMSSLIYYIFQWHKFSNLYSVCLFVNQFKHYEYTNTLY